MPRFAIGYNSECFDLVILQLERVNEIAGVHRCEHREDDGFLRRFPKDIMPEVIDGDVTGHKTADVGKRLKVLEGDGRIETPEKNNV